DGVYNKDPRSFSDAVKYDRISFKDFLAQGLGVMDASAVSLCMDSNIPIRVFSFVKHSLEQAIFDENIGTLICEEATHVHSS
ncbi:amino acid kinase family protein, partial [Chlamydia psittaci 84-8471/1]